MTKFSKVKIDVMYEIHEYFEKVMKDKGKLDWSDCIEYVSKKLGIKEVLILQAIVIDYTIWAYNKIESIKDEEIDEINKAIEKKKK